MTSDVVFSLSARPRGVRMANLSIKRLKISIEMVHTFWRRLTNRFLPLAG